VQDPPRTMPVDSHVPVALTLHNLGTGILCSRPPNPVTFSYRWQSEDNSPAPEGSRTPLQRVVPPGFALNANIMLYAPDRPGRYQLRITLVQEWVTWFDDINPENGCSLEVIVTGLTGLGKTRRRLLDGITKKLRRFRWCSR
jgi:hypothetical protein